MNPYMVVSYYTKDTGYKSEALKLAVSLERFKVPWHIEEIENRGTWQKNTLYKAQFIRRMMEKFKGKSIIFIDADAELKRNPALFEKLKCDVGYSIRDYRRFPSRSRKKGKEILSGTLYIANNERTRKFVDAWIEENKRNSRRWEQLNLAKILQLSNGKLSIKVMDARYCCIFDWMRSLKDPVVVHYQASRRLRFKVMTDETN